MGAQQSSQEGGSASADAVLLTQKTCYYEVLGVDRTSEDADIRRAYKKKALELHPDRNYNDEENATRKFAEVQTAYEVLSDPQERAWYDSHRDAILRGDPGDDDVDSGPQTHHNVRLTTTEEIMALIGRFNSRVPFNDSPTGFFGVVDITFGQLATEEAAACEWNGEDSVEYPPFGSAGDDHESTAKPFYSAWSNFSTRKSFAWKDKWRLSSAPDRRYRRAMEKENKKVREDATRDFNDAVRSLVAFVKKRDPRYVPNTQSEAQRQKVLRDSAAMQAARARAANAEKMRDKGFVVADWAQSKGDAEGAYDEEFATSGEESEVEEFECVVCSKVFKSEKQYESHEKSKKHTKAVQQLCRQMRKEGRDLDLHDEVPSKAADHSQDETDAPAATEQEARDDEAEAASSHVNGTPDVESDAAQSSSEDALDDEYAPREVVEARIASELSADASRQSDEDSGLPSKMGKVTLQDSEDPTPVKVGKAKAKRAKKAAQAQGQSVRVDSKDFNPICRKLMRSRRPTATSAAKSLILERSFSGTSKTRAMRS